MFSKRCVIVYISVLVLFSFLQTCQSLQCRACNITASEKHKGDPCTGVSSMVKCQDPAICLTVTYSVDDINSNLHQYTTIKSCYLKMNGIECDTYLKNIKNMYPASTKVEYKEKCFTCETDECNEKNDSRNNIPTLLMAVLCYLFVNLMLNCYV